MTTKHKIIAGFVCMIAILGVGSFAGYSYLDKSIDGLLEYRRLARMNVRTSDALASLNAAATAVNMYLLSRDPEAVTRATASLKEMDGSIAAAETEMSRQENLTKAKHIRELGRAYGNDLNKLGDLMRTMLKQYQDRVIPDSRNMNEAFRVMAENAAANNNNELLLTIERAWSEYAFMLSALGRFYYGRAEADRALIEQRVTAMKPLLQKMESIVISPLGRETYAARLKPAADGVFAAAANLIQTTGDVDKVIADILAGRAAMGKALPELSAHYDQRMNEGGAAITAESRNGQKMLLGGSAIGLLLGLTLAVFIIYGLIRVLREAGNLAKAVAEGNFAYTARVKEGGEIGAMVADIRQIPSVLQSILGDYTKLEKSIVDGVLDAKGDPVAYKGGFATLVAGTNAILDRFIQLLDNLPSPVLVFDRDCRLAYMNSVGRNLGGEDYKGKTDKQISNRDDADTSDDALRQAASTLRSASAETVCKPQGKRMDISYTVIPMFDKERKLSSLVELVTDLTSIKETQRKIQHVADQAASISNRVAAASEQLSAQVEQVSRGAETQRIRVESTASAMTEMNSTVLEVARNAGQASEQSELTKNKANDGAVLVENVVRSINQVHQVASTLQTNMRDLGNQAESIGGVINVISDIADQTNLLALNAAIEAARAGDAGRGFAVVADEVRKLAEKTMSATQEVGMNIKSIQNSTRTNIDEVNTAAGAVAEATELANTSGQALTEIVNLASASSSVVASIATAAEQQSATSEEINRAIEEINQIVSETTDGMVQSSAAVQELAVMAQELNTVMAELHQ